MELKRSQAIAALEAGGLQRGNLDKMDNKALAQKVKSLNNLVDDDTTIEDKDLSKLVDSVLNVIKEKKSKAAFTVVDDEGAAPTPEAAPSVAEEKKSDKAAEKAKKDEEKQKKKEAAEKAKAEKEANKGPVIPGVRETITRPYLAGVIIAKAAGSKAKADLYKVGVTEEMVAELDKAYGKPNPAESTFCLRNAWHAIRGFNFGKAEDLTVKAEGGTAAE